MRDGLDVVVGGVGPAASGAAAAQALTRRPYGLVLSAGIAGGFPPAGIGDVVVADEIVFADLGAETSDGFVLASTLGFGDERSVVPSDVVGRLRSVLPAARVGAVLTAATVTGTAATAAARQSRHPSALAEAMEGAGVAVAATSAGVPFGEVRAISNAVGPRDRAAWRVPHALDVLGAAINAVAQADWTA